MRRESWAAAAAAFAGFLWFLRLGGGPGLWPGNIDWLFQKDWAQHVLGWLAFRNEPWAFPLGTLKGALYPLGSTIGFTDSNPLVSVALKPFAGLLPTDFQFIGPWLAACFMLQGYFGARLASVFTRVPLQQFLGGCLLLLSPVLAVRVGHDTLCAHWLIVALLYLALRHDADAASLRRGLRLSVLLAGFAAGTHPYLAAMTLALAFAYYACAWRDGRWLTWRGAAAWAAVATGTVLAVFAVFGYLGKANVAAGGFGVYSADLLTLANPMEYSRVLPSFPVGVGQPEGFGFLGLGGLFGCAVAAIRVVRRGVSWRRNWPLLAACAAMAIYALSWLVTLHGEGVITMRHFYANAGPLVETFRASGRFVWPLHYLLLAAAVWGCVRVGGRGRLATALLATALAAQLVDFRPTGGFARPIPFRRLSLTGWVFAEGRYQHIALVPMQVLNSPCSAPIEPETVQRYAFQAYRLRMTFNSGIFARFDLAGMKAECARAAREIDEGPLDARTIYVVSPERVARMRAAGATCRAPDGDWVCVDARGDEEFREFLRRIPEVEPSPMN